MAGEDLIGELRGYKPGDTAVRENIPSAVSERLYERTEHAPTLTSLFAPWLGSSPGEFPPVSWDLEVTEAGQG